MFRAVWATIKAFANNEGLTAGMTAILHTWGSNLYYHPHIHCIVPGGGIDNQGVWHHLKGCKDSNFLFPVYAMRLKENGVIIDQKIRKQCFDEDWVVNSRPPAKGINLVLEYIARYAYRVAITNSRRLDVANRKISYPPCTDGPMPPMPPPQDQLLNLTQCAA